MNNERAIELLDDLARCVNCGEIELNEEDREALRMAIEALKNERQKGKWIRITQNTASTQMWVCSICGRTVEKNTVLDPDIFFPFCHCGADMREADDETD